MVAQEACTSDQSQSLLQGWINFPSLPEYLSKPDLALNAAVEGQQNKSVDVNLNGLQKDSEEKISEELSNKHLSPEVNTCLDVTLEDILTVEKEETAQDTFLHVSEDCQRTCMTITDTDNRVKEHSPNNDTDLPLTSTGKIFMEAFTEQSIEAGEFEISDVLRSPSDSKSLKTINPLPGKLECQGCAFSIDPSAEESSDALPVQLETALNALSVSVDPVTSVVSSESQFNAEGKQPGFDQQREKEAISDYCNASSGEKPTGEASSQSVEAALCAETAQTTSRTAMQLRETPSRKCRYRVSSYGQILDETQPAMSHSGSTTGNKAKDFDKTQKSTSTDKKDLKTNVCQEITLTGDREVEQRRRSKRTENRHSTDDSKTKLCAQSVEDTDLHQISLQRCESEPACADSTGILQQTTVNEVQNFSTNISEDGTSCTEQTLQATAETRVAQALFAATNGQSVSGSPCNSTNGVLSTIEQKAPQPEKGGRILLHAEESVEGCHMEIENASGLEIEPVALRLPEKGTVQMTQKREVLLETNSKVDLNFDVNVDSKSPYSLQMVENTQKETSQKTDEVALAGVSGTEKSGEEENAKTSVLSQFPETVDVRIKRIRLHPLETSQKADSYSNSNKTRLSSNQSQSSRASEQQTPKKSESSVSTRKEAVILHGTYNTRAGRKMKTKRNAKGETQLHVAARRGDLSLVKTLISSGICVNEQDYAGWTAIHEAANRGFAEVILELLKAGADVNSRNVDGVLPIHDAVCGNYVEAARILLQYGANPCESSDSGVTALDVAEDDEMKELLKLYSATNSALPVETIEVTERRHPSRSRTSIRQCCNDSKSDDAALELQNEKHSLESTAAIQDAEEMQKGLLLLELRTPNDADVYIQRLSQTQNTLNEMLAIQKTERDTLAKKHRASVESFKEGALRNQLVHPASRPNHLLTVAQTQEILVQKTENFRKAKQGFSASCSETQISNSVISCRNDKRQSLTADEIVCRAVLPCSMGPDASVPPGNRVEAHLSLENRLSAQECSRDPQTHLDETEANREAIRSKGASDRALASKSQVGEYPFDSMSMLSNAVEVMMLPSEPTVPAAKTKCSQQKDIDCIAAVEEGIKSLNPTSVTDTLNVVKPRSAAVNSNVCQPGSDYQQVLTDEGLYRCLRKEEAFQQQQQVILSTPTKNFPNTPQQVVFWSGENLLNTNLMLEDLTSDTDYPVKLSEKSSQSYRNQECRQNQLRHGRRYRKKLQLIDLLELGRIKPGENVLEYKLQEFSHKATLLKNGKIKTSRRQIWENPVQWVKDLLGSDISVTWKYVWNKVTYLGTQLSKFVAEEATVSSDLELPLQERYPLRTNSVTRDPSNHEQHHQSPATVSTAQPCGSSEPSSMQQKSPSLPQTEVVKTLLWTEREAAITKALKSSSVQFNSMESLTHFLQFREIVMVRKEEFLPCSEMEKHWNFYKGCEGFGF